MINEILESIAGQLGDIFKPPKYHFYIEDTNQNLVEPCFLIKRVSASQRERMGPRLMLDELYSVTILCGNDVEKLRELTAFTELNLRFIKMPDDRPIMTHNRNTTMIDDDSSVITFELTRSIWFEHTPPMQEKIIHKLGVD